VSAGVGKAPNFIEGFGDECGISEFVNVSHLGPLNRFRR
jgi:hypothetical protein